MPKIKSVPGQYDQQQNMQYSSTQKYAKLNNYPQTRNAQYLTPIVPIHQVPYNPQFSKSPLASVQMSRKPHLRITDEAPKNVQYNNYNADYHVQPQGQSKWNWKTILCWALAILGIIALAVGLYFLIDSLLSRKKSGDNSLGQNRNIDYQPPKNDYYTGVNPIYVNPIPYNRIYATSTYPTTIDDRTTYPSPSSFSPVTNPINPPTTYPTINQPLNPPTISTNLKTNTQPNTIWNANPAQNSISPLDVYASASK